MIYGHVGVSQTTPPPTPISLKCHSDKKKCAFDGSFDPPKIYHNIQVSNLHSHIAIREIFMAKNLWTLTNILLALKYLLKCGWYTHVAGIGPGTEEAQRSPGSHPGEISGERTGKTGARGSHNRTRHQR